jgi:hypothetical protein
MNRNLLFPFQNFDQPQSLRVRQYFQYFRGPFQCLGFQFSLPDTTHIISPWL